MIRYIIVLLIFIGCQSDYSLYNIEVDKFIFDIKNVNSSHFNFFKNKKIDGLSCISEKKSGKLIFVVYNFTNSKDSLNNYLNEFKKINNQYVIQAADTGTIYCERNNYSFSGIMMYNDSIPVPHFRGVLSMLENKYIQGSKLPEDFKIYVIEAKRGKYIVDSLLVNDTVVPEPWEHGFSRGVAISEERLKVVVWLSIW